MNFEAVFEILLRQFEKEKIRVALIGGFALSVVGYVRATNDIDFLVDKDDTDRLKKILLAQGYELSYESGEVSTFVNPLMVLGRVDFLYAHRKYSKAMLERAKAHEIFNGKLKVKVVTPEDLIGLKVQSSSNDPSRYHQDMADIEHVLLANKGKLDIVLIREYFELFGRAVEFEKLLGKVNA